MVETLLEDGAPWLAGNGPEAAIAVCSQCSLLRDLADFPFPSRCSDKEMRAIEERILNALEHLGLLNEGTYHSPANLGPPGMYLLAESRLVHADLLVRPGRRGVYVANDRSMAISVNGSDHLCMTAIASGLQLRKPWVRLAPLDDRLARILDFAFNEQLGYLTASLGHTGTGLKASVVLHLPALGMVGGVEELASLARKELHAIYGLGPAVRGAAERPLESRADFADTVTDPADLVRASGGLHVDLTERSYGTPAEAFGDLYLLTNKATLGRSEDEVLLHLRYEASGLIDREKAARETLLREEPRRLEDRVGRAFGVARNARLLGFDEALGLLSSLRLGVDAGLAEGYGYVQLNDLLLASQAAHLRTGALRECDELTLSVERADLFRTRLRKDTGKRQPDYVG